MVFHITCKMGQSGKNKCLNCCFVTTGIIGVLLAVGGICLLHYFPIIFETMVKKQVILANNSTGFQEWENPPAPIFLQFYVWNLENPEEVAKGGKPNVTQQGPYTYRETRPKINVTDDVNGTISYVSPQTFVFDPERSIGDPQEDSFTTLNVPLLTVINQIRFMGGAKALIRLISTLFRNIQIYGSYKVHDFIWGYPDPLLTFLKTVDPKLVPTDVFGVFAGRNDSDDGVYVVYTGETDYKLTNRIYSWNGNRSLSFWSTPEANMINGTDGTYNHPFIKKDESIYVFSSDICRSIFAVFERDTTTHGISTWRFSPPAYLFANYTVYPPNIGFCTPNANFSYPGGLLNVSECQFGAPIFMSSPHFLYADQSVFDMITGVNPVKELHETFFDVEPNTGGPLNVSKKIQINAHLQQYSYARWYNDVSEAYVPLVWVNESGVVTQESADQLKEQLYLPLKIGQYAPWASLGLGALLCVLCMTCFTVKICSSKGQQLNGDERSPLLSGGGHASNAAVAT